MTEPKIIKFGESLGLGEGPHWDAESQCLYYVDITGKTVLKYNPSTGAINKCKFPQTTSVSVVVPITGSPNKFVIAFDRKVAIVTWDGVSETPSSIEEICEVDSDAPLNRINDGKCDPFGRLYAGTMGPENAGEIDREKGTLYLFDLKKKTAKKLLDKVSISNGLAWDLEKKKFYYIDSYNYSVDQFDYDPETGDISNRQTAFDFKTAGIPGLPDGMCIDKEGMLWVACFMGGRVIRIDPERKRLIRTICIPAKQTTSVAFGGPNLNELYVTSASMFTEKENPDGGMTFKITRLGDIRGAGPGVTVPL